MDMLDEIIKRAKNLTFDQQKEMLKILKEWQKGKQREYQRLETAEDIDIAVGDRVIQTTTRDLSASGIFIKTKGKVDENKEVKVVFSVPGYEKPFKLDGMIARVEQDGIAIKFENITPYFKQVLDGVIWNNKDQNNSKK